MGVFKIYVNGKTVADDYLSPGWVDYNKKMPFVRYDITSLLDEQNAIGVVLGDGDEHFRPLFTFHGFRYAEITIIGDAIAEIPYCHYKTYGDIRIIRDNLPAKTPQTDFPVGLKRF